MLLSTERIVLILMLLLGIFGVGIGSMHFFTLGCLILLRTPILDYQCQGAIRFMNKRNDEFMMKEFGRWRELAFSQLGPSATTVFRKRASMLAEKWNIMYCHCLFWVRCRLCFSLLRSGVVSLRGTQEK